MRTGRIPARGSSALFDEGDEGNWTGISVELWQWLAADLEVAYDFEERTLPGLFDELADGSLDASIGALTVTADRERKVDFSHPFYQTGLGIAVAGREESGPVAILRRIFSADAAVYDAPVFRYLGR